ncbi:ADP-ribosylglycohydrolase family protein [Streptomyces sp. NPDC015171]|uniref:ADP-ribosylglycohydrolase family protein n=1 Tax=Streptomyces sp. NPDC015171 TaxID=3364945 RepID=UPI0036FC9473
MSVLVAESLLKRGGHLRPLPAVGGIGPQTEDVLTNGMPRDRAAVFHFQVSQRAAANCSSMRASASAVRFSAADREAAMDAAHRIAALTHGDRTAGGTAGPGRSTSPSQASTDGCRTGQICSASHSASEAEPPGQ